MTTLIKHDGMVIKSENGTVTVKINSKSACSGCHAKGACGGMDCLDKDITIYTLDPYNVGDHVSVSISTALGFTALFWGYLLPFIILVGTIVLCISLELKEDSAALTGLGATATYYLLLYPLRKKLAKKFQFKIEQKVNFL